MQQNCVQLVQIDGEAAPVPRPVEWRSADAGLVWIEVGGHWLELANQVYRVKGRWAPFVVVDASDDTLRVR